MSDTLKSTLSNYQLIPVAQIRASTHQARKDFDDEAIKGLAASMKLEGLLEPIVIRQVESGYELISGERRLRAAKLLGWEAIEAKIIQTVSEGEASAKGLVENLQRENLNPIEEAEGFHELSQLDPGFWTHEKIGQIIGKDRTFITKSLALLTLPEVVLADVRQRTLSREHAIELLRLNNANSQKAMAKKIVEGGWSVKKTREAIDKKQGKLQQIAQSAKQPADSFAVPADRSTLPLDPLAAIWSSVLANPEIAPQGNLKIDYMGGQEWNFRVVFPGDTFRMDLINCFEKIAQAIKRVKSSSQETPTDQDLLAQIPATEEEFKRLEEAQKNDSALAQALRDLEEGGKIK